MSDDEVDHELIELLRQSLLGSKPNPDDITSDTKVLRHAEYIYNNSIDVNIDARGTRAAAQLIWSQMQLRCYSTETWSEHELHPKAKDEATLNFIFVMDLLNFSFWSEKPESERYAVEYRGQTWTGYWSLVACLQRALDEDIPITTPSFYADESECPDERIAYVFRSSTGEEIPMLQERITCLRDAGQVLEDTFDGSVANLVAAADNSAGKLVNLLAHRFSCFKDESIYEKRAVRIMKRPQILVADIWAAFNEESYGEFHDIDSITMFADYRVPQILHTLGCLTYSPPLDSTIRTQRPVDHGSSYEVQLRGCSIWAVELLRREIVRNNPGAKVNAILIDFFLYDLAKEKEKAGEPAIPHHRTRSIWY
ncbi:hypothetical protein AUEXF2481DRAFT_97722 [Aureobasidium subglaciale EXF-2481]|uniref:Queuosine 5'-phosphate N-glycosylase/hydrolase n=1 Tax=Aureobasidium subglaciale (strain EXF-2481) TaxID=1043005 RepID=A0A074YMT6_AURSE|nr:uncharacterized protein AUEXF2481DRAFT_97722 [Aureobasidium subglaciale EXF-2481]KAI5204946.1 hypothetical protein E4T38_04463 [Aureobasidium subglaciale]KAI5223945.1 hypothetical protein E4T40_04239 [Aureobasidium subglaciale]KAI5227391.1 hypothetical protein E4T41_04321 [Aureobasidium subglaciale]KAI5262671.1 hypothetical protein E4T46_04207 [Aureobasidium subglaciale]KEQ95427.1 hypothetical protein AUEXF2481DRAFT_97722 [Aureobasidium subglaciale EXF-2481]